MAAIFVDRNNSGIYGENYGALTGSVRTRTVYKIVKQTPKQIVIQSGTIMGNGDGIVVEKTMINPETVPPVFRTNPEDMWDGAVRYNDWHIEWDNATYRMGIDKFNRWYVEANDMFKNAPMVEKIEFCGFLFR